MKFLRKILDELEPFFKKGEPLEKGYVQFEAMDTLLFTGDNVTKGKVHVRDGLDSKRLMITVLLALLPCLIFTLYNTGFQRLTSLGLTADPIHCFCIGLQVFLPLYAVTMAVGGFWEVIFATLRKHEINEGFLVTGILFPLILPPTMPLWQVAIGISVGVVIGKEVFGGTGRNIVNPALLGRAFLFFSYPASISGEGIWALIDGTKEKIIDGISAATPLGVAAAVPAGGNVVDALNAVGFTLEKMFIGCIPGSIGETSALYIGIGGLILIYTKVASWRTMLGCVVGALAMGFLFNALAGPDSNPLFHIPAHYHLVMGGFAFGAVFMATDPVSSAATKTGKLFYGFFIGLLAVLIRCINPAYPEGMMLAILLMNVFAPLIDHFVMGANIKRRVNRGKK